MSDAPPALPLSAVVTAGVGAVLAIAAACAVAGALVVRETTVGRLELEGREQRRDLARQRLAIALLDQEMGRRGIVATGNRAFLEAYDRGVREESEAWSALFAAFGESGDVSGALARVRGAVDAWHEQVVLPQLFLSRAAPLEPLPRALEDGKARFDEIRAALGALAEAQAAQARARGTALQRHGRWVLLSGAVPCLVLVACGALLLVWGRRRLALPLQLLAAQVESGARIEPPAARNGIREIATLRAALARLDRRVSERESVLRAEREDAELLGRFADIVQQTTSEAELYRLLVRFLDVAVEPAATAVFSLNPSENHLAMVHPAASPDEQYRLPLVTEPMRCRAIRSARDVLFRRAQDPGVCDCPLASSCSHLCIPLMATGQVIGLVSLRGPAADHWTPRRAHLAASLAATASTTLNSIRLLARSRDNAVRDPLTHAYNRRFLVEILPKLVHQSARTRAPLSALMVDVDRFKDFNDRHGHDAGDRVLAAVSRCLGEQIRMSDTLVRHGGEEFAILLPNTSAQGALTIAERARQAVEATRTTIPQSERPLSVTISVGVATLPEHGATGDELLLAADKALFLAKDAGRNRVVAAVASPGPRGTALALAAAYSPDTTTGVDAVPPAEPSPSCPRVSSPQHRTEPSPSSAQL